VPTDTTRLVSYSFPALCRDSPDLARRFLGFNCRFDAIDVASGKYTAETLVGRSSAVPDLTAFLAAFSSVFPDVKLSSADVIEQQGQLKLSKDRENKKLSVLEMTETRKLEDHDIEDAWSKLSVEGELLCLRR